MSATWPSEVWNEGENRWISCGAGACLCVKQQPEECGDSGAALSVLVTSHAERVCGEYRRAVCVLLTLHAWGQSAKKESRKWRNIIFSALILLTVARSLAGNRVSDRKLGASACYLAIRRHQGTGEGKQRVVNTDESNYWHLQPTSLLCAWTKLKGHRCEGFGFISVYQFTLWVSHYP